ncbi:metallophosphoesterase [Hymenobacter sp. BT662]|uniref:Metallophosphoesterase n=1 Tax=Hymenobacter ruricola TaxID=2791023 RepID=A0ABS0IAE9_9BACT|nr:metallophosphoesterase [Hymenobacter ruricola]
MGKSSAGKFDMKVVQVSDIHIHSVNHQLKQLAQQLNTLKPDLILITGDAVDEAGNIHLLNTFLRLININLKKVAILGNWEYWGRIDLTALKHTYTENNCDLLVNESRQYSFRNKTIALTGVDDYIGGTADIDFALTTYRKSDYHIILNHCPQYSETIATQVPKTVPVDFILSGHTHGGQINLFGFVPFTPRGSGKYLKGWYNDNALNMYVSKGVGTSILPARFMARAEIAVFYMAT